MNGLLFKMYSLISIGGTALLINNAIKTQSNYYDTVMFFCSSKPNLVLLLNCFLALISNAAHLLIYVFFTQIRINEAQVSPVF